MLKTRLVTLTANNDDNEVMAWYHTGESCKLDSLLAMGWTMVQTELMPRYGTWKAILQRDETPKANEVNENLPAVHESATLRSFLEAMTADSLYACWLDALEGDSDYTTDLIEDVIDSMDIDTQERWDELRDEGWSRDLHTELYSQLAGSTIEEIGRDLYSRHAYLIGTKMSRQTCHMPQAPHADEHIAACSRLIENHERLVKERAKARDLD